MGRTDLDMQRSDQSMPEPANRLGRTVPVRWLVGVLLLSAQAGAQDAPIDPMAEDSEDEEVVVLDGQVLTEREVEAIQTESQGSENPDAQRRIDRETAPDPDDAERSSVERVDRNAAKRHPMNTFTKEAKVRSMFTWQNLDIPDHTVIVFYKKEN